MTDPRCIPVEELARVRDLPAGSPEREHLESCPGCRARLLALAEFERTDVALPREAGAGQAHAKLDAVIESLTAAPAPPRPVRERSGWLRRLFAPPAMRYATAFAVLAVVAAAAWLVSRPPGAPIAPGGRVVPGERLVRGETVTAGAATVRATADGWELAWPRVEGAESYDVVFLDAELREVGRIAEVRGTSVRLVRDALPAGVVAGAPLLVEIDALAGGGVFEFSTPVPVTLR